MVCATVIFAVAWLLQRPGYLHGEVRSGGWIVAAIAEVLLAAGGYIGGTIVFHYGHRVLNQHDTPMPEALRPVPHRPPIETRPDPAPLGSTPDATNT